MTAFGTYEDSFDYKGPIIEAARITISPTGVVTGYVCNEILEIWEIILHAIRGHQRT